MSDTLDPRNIDARLAERFIKKGQLNPKDWDKHLKGLPDSAEKAAPIDATMEELGVTGTGRIEADEE